MTWFKSGKLWFCKDNYYKKGGYCGSRSETLRNEGNIGGSKLTTLRIKLEVRRILRSGGFYNFVKHNLIYFHPILEEKLKVFDIKNLN